MPSRWIDGLQKREAVEEIASGLAALSEYLVLGVSMSVRQAVQCSGLSIILLFAPSLRFWNLIDQSI